MRNQIYVVTIAWMETILTQGGAHRIRLDSEDPAGMEPERRETMTCYRIQKRGLSLKHTSEDWAGERFVEPGRVCCYDDLNSLLAGEGDDWKRGRDLEVVEFEGRDVQELGGAHIPGVSAVPVREIRRTSLLIILRAVNM